MGGICILLGLVIGSFANAVVYRLPRELNYVNGHSMCPNCQHRLGVWDLIPIVSWLWLRGRCRYCHERIAVRYPLVELYTGIMFGLAYHFLSRFGIMYLAFSFFLILIFLLLALIDLDSLILPDTLLLAATISWLVYVSTVKYAHQDTMAPWYMISPVVRGIYGGLSWWTLLYALVMFIFFWIIWLLSSGRAIGLGDGKYMAVLTLIFTIEGSLFILYGAIILGGLVSGLLLLLRRAGLKTQLPLGTFISIAGTLYLFVGMQLLTRYYYFFV